MRRCRRPSATWSCNTLPTTPPGVVTSP